MVAFYAIVHLAVEHLPAALPEVRRVLRPGGIALVAFHVGDEVVRPGEMWGSLWRSTGCSTAPGTSPSA